MKAVIHFGRKKISDFFRGRQIVQRLDNRWERISNLGGLLSGLAFLPASSSCGEHGLWQRREPQQSFFLCYRRGREEQSRRDLVSLLGQRYSGPDAGIQRLFHRLQQNPTPVISSSQTQGRARWSGSSVPKGLRDGRPTWSFASVLSKVTVCVNSSQLSIFYKPVKLQDTRWAGKRQQSPSGCKINQNRNTDVCG